MTDIREAKFYVCEDKGSFSSDLRPLDFDTAFREAAELVRHGGGVHIMYTDDASQSQLTQLASAGIPAGLVPQGWLTLSAPRRSP